MNIKKKAAAALLALVMVLSPMAPLAAAAEDTITIRTVQDLEKFSQQCSLDSWSQGKTVVLEADIDLTSRNFTPIPTFGGTFDGQGHTISGLRLSGSGDTRGLFRYIQSTGEVRNLKLGVSIDPTGHQDTLGGLAGSNSGKLANCSVQGTIQGKNQIGGIVGSNEAGGQLINCQFEGSVTGEHSAGGVAGQNLGSIIQCENNGSVNTAKTSEAEVETGDLDLKQLNSTKNAPVRTDIGGIAGFSSGILQSCVNRGSVGYQYTGCNVGGIAGRQSGYLDGCVNSGTIQGRKDVGGIVGQLEPETVQAFSQDFLDRLLDQLDSLQDLMDRTLNHADQISDSVSAQMHTLSDRTRTLKATASDLSDAITDWANGNIDQINDLLARVSWTLDQLDPIMDDAVDALKDLEKATDRLGDALDAAKDSSEEATDALEKLDDARQDLRRALDAADRIIQAMEDLRGSLGDDPDEVLNAMKSLLKSLNAFHTIISALQDADKDLAKSLDLLQDAGSSLTTAIDRLNDAGEHLDDVLDSCTGIAEGLRDIVSELAEKPDIQFRPIDESITDRKDALNAAMDDLLDSVDSLTDVVDSSSDTLLADMRAINQQFRSIVSLIREEKQDLQQDLDKSREDQLKDLFQDLSDQGDPSRQTAGRVSASKNTGTVRGDQNAAGIAGSIGVEYDYDPDDDLMQSGSRSFDFRYQAKAVAFSCVNQGYITARKDCAGGIAGCAGLGLVSGCENYGKITSTDGAYVGGIAGSFGGTIRASWAKCALSGKEYVGGIAGLGSSLSDCRALVSAENGETCLGAIAGDLDDDALLSGNLFTSADGSLAGVDGVSYAGKAEPVSFDALCASQSVPEAFARMELTFTADGKTVEVVPFQYGGGVDHLPKLPAKKGYAASWPDMDYSHLTASQTVEAVYTPYQTSLSEGGILPEILVDGSFSTAASVTHTTQEVSWTAENGKEYSGTAYTVTVTDPDLDDVEYTVHFRLPEKGGRYELWVQDGDGSWQRHDFTVDGSYLLLSGQTGPVTFCVQPRAGIPWAVILAAAALLVLVCAAALVLMRRRRKRRRKSRN